MNESIKNRIEKELRKINSDRELSKYLEDINLPALADLIQPNKSVEIKNIGKAISVVRKAKGLTQERLAIKSNISYSGIVKIERNKIKNPKIKTLIKISNALGVTVDDILSFAKKQQ
jgi:DNA-binding XRE family transcriptional regulator